MKLNVGLHWIFLVLLVLKLSHVIDWSWLVIFIPLYPIFALLILLIIMILTSLINEKS